MLKFILLFVAISNQGFAAPSMIPSSFFSGGGGGGPTYATLNPSDKTAGGALSNGDLTFTANSAAWSSARGTISKSSGKWFWEVTVNSNNFASNGVIIGVSTGPGFPNGPSACTDSWGYENAVGRRCDGTNIASYGTAYSTGAVIGVALDLNAGSIEFFYNGASQAQAYASGISGNVFPIVTAYGNDQVTVNFGATPFVHSVPSGFTAGFY